MGGITCSRCRNVTHELMPTGCRICGLGAPELDRPLGVNLSVLLSAIIAGSLAGLAAVAAMVALDTGVLAKNQIVLDVFAHMYNSWIPFGLAAGFSLLITVAAFGVQSGRTWGRGIQRFVAWTWFVGGMALIGWSAFDPPTATVAADATGAQIHDAQVKVEAVLWAAGGALTLGGFAWVAFLGTIRPTRWFRNMAEERNKQKEAKRAQQS